MNKRFLYEILKASGLLKYFPSTFCLLNDGSIDIISNCCMYRQRPENSSFSRVYIENGDGNSFIKLDSERDSGHAFCTSAKLVENCIRTNNYAKSIKHIYNNINIRENNGNYENYIITDDYE